VDGLIFKSAEGKSKSLLSLIRLGETYIVFWGWNRNLKYVSNLSFDFEEQLLNLK
jgi:hypothetical protein